MSKRVDNLMRILAKFQMRYGADDALVVQLAREIMAVEAQETYARGWQWRYSRQSQSHPYRVNFDALASRPALDQVQQIQ